MPFPRGVPVSTTHTSWAPVGVGLFKVQRTFDFVGLSKTYLRVSVRPLLLLGSVVLLVLSGGDFP